MVELSDEELARFEKEFNCLRVEVYVLSAVFGAIMANAVTRREQSLEFYQDLRAQAHKGLTRVFTRDQTPEKLREMYRKSLNDFFDEIDDQLGIAQTNKGRSGTH